MGLPFHLGAGITEGGEKPFAVGSILENIIPMVSAIRYVIHRAWRLNAQAARHAAKFSVRGRKVNQRSVNSEDRHLYELGVACPHLNSRCGLRSSGKRKLFRFDPFYRRVAGGTGEYMVGSFAGFQLFVRPAFLQRVEIILKGHNQYTANIAETAFGTIRSVEHAIQSLEERLERNQRDLADSEKRCRELETKIGQSFEHEAKLHSLYQRQLELENALDITKNQSASSLSSEEPSDQNEPVKLAESVATKETVTARQRWT